MDQTFVSHLFFDHRIPVKTGIHSDKNPIGMFFFQGIERVLIRSRKLLYIRVSGRIRKRHRQIGQVQPRFFPGHKILIGRRQELSLYIPFVFRSVLIEQNLIPDSSLFVKTHIRNLHGLTADCRTDRSAARRRIFFHLISIAQKNQRKNTFLF